MSSVKYVIGSGALLGWAEASWREVAPDCEVRRIDIGQNADYDFDLGVLDAIDPRSCTAFVAWGPQFLNFRRLELMGELKSRGLKMPPLLCAGAIVSSSARIGENTMVGAGTTVAPDGRVGFNCVIGAGAQIGFAARIDASAWIGEGAQLGAQVHVGANATLGRRCSVADGIRIGKYAVLEQADPVTADVPAKTFYVRRFREPVVILDGGA